MLRCCTGRFLRRFLHMQVISQTDVLLLTGAGTALGSLQARLCAAPTHHAAARCWGLRRPFVSALTPSSTLPKIIFPDLQDEMERGGQQHAGNGSNGQSSSPAAGNGSTSSGNGAGAHHHLDVLTSTVADAMSTEIIAVEKTHSVVECARLMKSKKARPLAAPPAQSCLASYCYARGRGFPSSSPAVTTVCLIPSPRSTSFLFSTLGTLWALSRQWISYVR